MTPLRPTGFQTSSRGATCAGSLAIQPHVLPDRKRLLAEWLKARDAEGETAKIVPPDERLGTRLGPRPKAKC